MGISEIRIVLSRLAIAGVVVSLAACSTTGRSFNSLALAEFVPGQTTLQDAIKMFGSEPVNTYSQLNGAMLARWAHKGSVLTDAIYFRQEVLLRFDPQGRFVSVADTVNVISQPGVPNPEAAQRVINEPTQPTPVERIKISSPVSPVSAVPSAAAAAAAAGTEAAVTTAVTTSVPEPQPVSRAPTTAPVPATSAPAPSQSSGMAAKDVLNQPISNPSVNYPVPAGRR